eukprot:SAG22_NODE_1818_length_3514_cov_10.657980_5_plen_129_part_00
MMLMMVVSSVDLVTLKHLISEAKRTMKLARFLQQQFSCVTKDVAERITSELSHDPKLAAISDLSDTQVMQVGSVRFGSVRFGSVRFGSGSGPSCSFGLGGVCQCAWLHACPPGRLCMCVWAGSGLSPA